MTEVGAYEAKTHLPQLLKRVAQGEEIIITRHGVPVARLAPVGVASREDIVEAIEELQEFRERHSTGGAPVLALIEEGRRS